MDGLSAPDIETLASLGRGNGPNLAGVSSEKEAEQVAQEFEGYFIAQMLQAMFSQVKTPEGFGGGPGEDSFKGLLVEEYGKLLSKTGGIGLADNLKAEILRLQEGAMAEAEI